MNNLKPDQNSDILETCLPLNESLFTEVYNKRIWEWFFELGLTKDKSERNYLVVKNKKLLFDDKIRKNAFESMNKNIFSRIINSMKVAKRMIDVIDMYDESEISNIYNIEMDFDYSNISIDKKIDKIIFFWNKLILNFKNVVVADLLIQWELKFKIDEKYLVDLVSKKYNSMIDLKEGKISNKIFLENFGYCAKFDYDFSSPRFYEYEKLDFPYTKRLVPTNGIHNFREHLKFQNIKLIAILRKLFLSFNDPNIFYRYYEEILNQENKDVSSRIQSQISEEDNSHSLATKGDQLNGVCLSGNSDVESDIFILNNLDDIANAPEGSIVVTDTLHPDLVVLFPIVKGIVAQVGGRLSHVAIVAREKEFPVIGQVENAISLLKGHKKIRMNTKNGLITILE